MMSLHDRTSASRKCLLLTAVLLPFLALPARAEDKKPDSSLGLIPADAAYYSAMLRNREQFDAVANSKAWANITKLPFYQMGMLLLQQQYQGENFAPVRQWLEQEENRDLVEMLKDSVSTEIFCYGAGNWVDFIDLLQQAYNGAQYGPLAQLIKDPQNKDPKAIQYAQARHALRALARNPNKIKVPDFVVGFKIKNAKKAEAQLDRLEMLLQGVIAGQPMLAGRIKRVKVGDSRFLTATLLDGDMAPWDQIDWKDVEEAAGEFDGVRKSLKKLKLTISLGVRDDFLLFAIGSTTDGIKQLGGEGPRLLSRPELKPLVRAAGKRLTSISYSSKALAAKTRMSPQDIDKLATTAEQALDAAGIPEARRKAIMKDVSGLAGDLKKELTAPGASLSFSYLSDRGYEGYEYQYGEFPDRDSSKALTLLDHVGGDPILAVVGRSKGTLERYQTIAKWLKVAYGHVEPLVLEKLDEQGKPQYEKYSKLIFPLLKRFDAITGKMLLPSLADGQAGFVLDAKWKSKQWHPAMPASDKALPMPELALLAGVSDRALLETAVKSYGKLIEDALKLVKENAPPDSQPPFTKVPDPEVKSVKSGKLYQWRLPKEAQLDPRVALTAGLSDKVGVVTLSAEHAERLLASKPLKVEGGPLADTKRPLTGASYFNWPAFLDILSPWVMFALDQTPLPGGAGGGEKKDDGNGQQNQREQIIRHVRVVLDALKTIRVSTSATYIDEGALITHSEVVIRDQ